MTDIQERIDEQWAMVQELEHGQSALTRTLSEAHTRLIELKRQQGMKATLEGALVVLHDVDFIELEKAICSAILELDGVVKVMHVVAYDSSSPSIARLVCAPKRR